jgi:hypothetical protein
MAYTFSQFMTLVRTDNPHYKRISFNSSLDDLIDELKDKMFFSPVTKKKLERLAAFIPHDKQVQYRRSLGFLNTELGIRIGAIPCDPVMKFIAFEYQTGGYTGYNSTGGSTFVMLDPTTPNSPGPRGFVHRHQITWKSSNGNAASLATVRTREYVKFLTDTQAPPFNAIQDPDREFYAPGIQGTTGDMSGIDDHSTKLPALICRYPRVAGELIAQQWYQYSTDNGANWQNIEGAAYLIKKSVRREGNDWVFMFKKTNWLEHNSKKFHFEVDYTIGAPPAYLPRVDTDVASAGGTAADIKKWARRVVAKG